MEDGESGCAAFEMRQGKKVLRQRFGRVLAEARGRAGLSQEALAGKAGLHRTYISLVERGLRSPSLDVVESLARALGMATSELVRLAEGARA